MTCRAKLATSGRLKPTVQSADHNVSTRLHTTQTLHQQRMLPAKSKLPWREAALLVFIASGNGDVAIAADSVGGAHGYVPSPVNIGWEIYAGAIAGIIPFAIGSYQFIARILIQRRCEKCNGSGLVERGPFLRKCPECGGFFPWQGWKQFLTSTAAPGNGGVLRQPRNQDGVIYRIPPKSDNKEQD